MVFQQVLREPWKFLGLLLLTAPAGAWYKHVASPKYHTVGRASGLLMGVRRSPYLWRREMAEGASLPPHGAPQWLVQEEEEEKRPWSTFQPPLPPHLTSQVGPRKEASATRSAFWPQRSQARRSFLAAQLHQRRIQALRCPEGCQEMPWQSSPGMPPDRAMWKKGQRGIPEEDK